MSNDWSWNRTTEHIMYVNSDYDGAIYVNCSHSDCNDVESPEVEFMSLAKANELSENFPHVKTVTQ